MHKLFLAHPTIRLKGFEHLWEPVVCSDSECEFSAKRNHMHCPLCPLKVCSQDEAYMKMHFRVKHVDEGVDCEAGFFNVKCFSQCWVTSHQKEKQVRTPHWHCHRCTSVSTKKTELLAHFDSPKNKGKHDIATQIHIIQDINQGMDHLKNKRNEKNLTSTQKCSNNHGNDCNIKFVNISAHVTTQTVNESSSVLETRSVSSMTEGRLCQSREEECLTQRRQISEEKTRLEEGVLSLRNEKITMEDTIKHLHKESKRFKEKLLKVTRDNTKLRRQLKILTAIMLRPGRNRNPQGSSSASCQSADTPKSSHSNPSVVPLLETISGASVEKRLPSAGGSPPGRSSYHSPSTHLVTAESTLPNVRGNCTSSSPSSVLTSSIQNSNLHTTRGASAQVKLTAPSVPSTSSITNSMVINKERTTNNGHQEDPEMTRNIPSSQLVASNVVIPILSPLSPFSSFILTSNSLAPSETVRENTPIVLSNLSFLAPNVRLPIINVPPSLNCTSSFQSEATRFPCSVPAASSQEILPVMKSCAAPPEPDVAAPSSVNGIKPQSASHVPITNSSRNIVIPVDLPGRIQAYEERGNAPLHRKSDGIDARLMEANLDGATKSPTRNKIQPSLSSVRSEDNSMKNIPHSVESSSILLRNLATKVMERARHNVRRPAAPTVADPGKSGLQSCKWLLNNSNTTRGPFLFIPGSSNLAPSARNKSTSNTTKRKPPSMSGIGSSTVADGECSIHTRSKDASLMSRDSSSDDSRCNFDVHPSPTTTPRPTASSIVTSSTDDIHASTGNETPVSVFSEDVSESSTSISSQIKETQTETVHVVPSTAFEANCLQGQSDVAWPQNSAKNNQQGQTPTDVELSEEDGSVRNELSVQLDQSNGYVKDGGDTMSLVVNQTKLSNPGMPYLEDEEEREQSNVNLLEAANKSSVTPCESANQARKRALTKIVEMDFAALTPDISTVVESSSPSDRISTPSGTETSLFSSNGSIESLLDIHEYDFSSITELLATSEKQERFISDEIQQTESLLELFERNFAGGQDLSFFDQLPCPSSILEDRDCSRSEVSTGTSLQLSSILLANSDNEQGVHERDGVLIDIGNFCDSNFSAPWLPSASPSHNLSFLSILREMEDNQANGREAPSIPATSDLEYSGETTADTTTANTACSRTLDLEEVNKLVSESREAERASRGRKRRKSKKRCKSREKSRKPKRKKRKKNSNIDILS